MGWFDFLGDANQAKQAFNNNMRGLASGVVQGATAVHNAIQSLTPPRTPTVSNGSLTSTKNPVLTQGSNTPVGNTVAKYPQSQSNPSNGGGGAASSSSGEGIASMDDAAAAAMGADGSADGGTGDGSGQSSQTSPLLEGSMTFEELVGDICKGVDLIFAVKRSTVVVTDYEGIYAEAKYLREKNHPVAKSEDIALWQLEDGTYDLEVSEYGFYNTVKVYYKDGVVVESYEDLVRVYGEVHIDYHEKKIDKRTAQMKAKAYLAAHVRDFEMATKANILWDGEIDIGDIVTLENPMTMRDKYRVEKEKRDPEYFFVMGKSVEWDGDSFITGSLELRYGAASPEGKEVPETGASYSKDSSSGGGSSGDIQSALDAVGKKWHKMGYSGACQTYSCVQSHGSGDCWGCSDTIACELISQGVEARILQYPTSYVNNHRSVQYKDATGNWKDFPYRSYGFNTLFNNTSGTARGKQVACSCSGGGNSS